MLKSQQMSKREQFCRETHFCIPEEAVRSLRAKSVRSEAYVLTVRSKHIFLRRETQ